MKKRGNFWEFCCWSIVTLCVPFALAVQAPTTEYLWETPIASQSDLHCLIEALYFEARSEPVEGVLAVSSVILNRTEAKGFPSTICGVVKEQKVKGVSQFSYRDNQKLLQKPIDKLSYQQMQLIAWYSLSLHQKGIDNSNGALYYHSKNVKPTWSKVFTRTAVIGNHVFYTTD